VLIASRWSGIRSAAAPRWRRCCWRHGGCGPSSSPDAAIGIDVASTGGGPIAALLSPRLLRNAIVSATATNPLLTGPLLGRFVAQPAAVTDTRVRVLQAPLVVQGATDAFGDWLLDFLTAHEVLLSTDSTTYRSLALPALVIWGDRDTTTPLPQGQRLAQLIAGSELAVMAGIGHMPQLEDNDQFNRLLTTFLARQHASRPESGK